MLHDVPWPELFPATVVCRGVRVPADEADVPGIPLPRELSSALAKRRLEFLAGRHCAREALRALAPSLAEEPVPIGPHRGPAWPAGIVGAITHTDALAAAAVARSVDARGVGLDAAPVVTLQRARNLARYVSTQGELDSLRRGTGLDEAVGFTVIFSVKEAIFKALYPSVGRYFDFHDAEVTAVDLARGSFDARLVTALNDALPAGTALRGRVALEGDVVHTGMVLEPRRRDLARAT